MVSRRLLPLCALCAALAAAQPRARTPKPAGAIPPERAAVQRWMASMTLRDKVAQLVMIPFYGESPNVRSRAYRNYRHAVRDLRAGGLILINRVSHGHVLRAQPLTTASFLNRMQRLARVPLIVGGDFERGASMRTWATTRFPHNMAFAAAGDLEATRLEGAVTAREARAMGVHWIYAPVADVNNNPANPIINIRSYGEDPNVVAAHVSAYIAGARSVPSAPVLLTAKHFPGHGDTATDSHLGLGTVTASRERLDQVELVPFRAAIRDKVDSIMTAHLWVPAIEPQQIPATVSKAVLTDLLRKELGFSGLVVTDAMDMHGLSKQIPPGEAAVRAIEAGADLLLIPPKPETAIQAVVAAVQKGRLTRRRIDESVLKVLTAKTKVGLHRRKLVDLENLTDALRSEDAERAAHAVAANALTLVKNDRDLLPLASPGGVCWLLLAENRYAQQGLRIQDEVSRRAPAAKVMLLDPKLPESEFDAAAASLATCPAIAAVAFVSASAYRGDVSLPGGYPRLLSLLEKAGPPVILAALGNPYLLEQYPWASAYLAAFSNVPASEAALVKAIFGEAPVRGKSPVTIPGFVKVGGGIQVPARSSNPPRPQN